MIHLWPVIEIVLVAWLGFVLGIVIATRDEDRSVHPPQEGPGQ